MTQPTLIAALLFTLPALAGPRWTEDRANQWLDKTGWLVGCNFSPSSAINQLEMWQADTFDPATIDRELGWAKSLGFNSVRVFLHHIAWEQDPQGFLTRMEEFLKLTEKHKIGVLFVFFDSVWHPYPKPGKQPAPRPHLHNSGWVQDPGRDLLEKPQDWGKLEKYVKAVLEKFKADPRIHGWDLFNEPDNLNRNSYGPWEPEKKRELSLELLMKVFNWSREIDLAHPVTSGVWIGQWADPAKLSPTERVQLEQSDIISFHNYGNLDDLKKCVENLKRYKRPVLCTEYMARPAGSNFDPHLAYMKEQKVAAYNWGFVAGKTQTIYPWDSWDKKKYTAEPPVWFHDIFRTDGTAYRPEEVEYIRKVTGVK